MLQICCVLLCGCGLEEMPLPTLEIYDVAGINLQSGALTIGAEGGELRFCVKSNIEWKIVADAEWLRVLPSEGRGDSEVVVEVQPTETSRSVAMTARGDSQIHRRLDIIQWVKSNNDSGGDDGNGDDSGDDNGGGSNDDGGDDTGDDEPTAQFGENGEALNLAAISAGRYYMGGRRDNGLHLATGSISDVGHCCTAIFSFDSDGVPQNDDHIKAASVELIEAEGGFYLGFGDQHYLAATAPQAGALCFTAEPVAMWAFELHDDGGFVLRQLGDVEAKLIFSLRAQGDVLRLVDTLDGGGPVRMCRIMD